MPIHTNCKVFIGSSTEGLSIAKAICRGLRGAADVAIWKSIFTLSEYPLDALITSSESFDFAVIVLTPDDWVSVRGETQLAPRDNLVFEIGLFMGHLGRDRTYLAYDTADRVKIPTDFKGLTAATFTRPARGDISKDALAPACDEIIERIHKMGPRKHSLYDDLTALNQYAKRAALIPHPVFQQEIRFRYQEFLSNSEHWAAGTFIVRNAYENILRGVFENARKEIFSTSVPQYRQTWSSEFGDRLLRVQRDARKRGVRSTRVFVFNKESDVTEEDQQIFARHSHNGIRVLLYYDGENRFQFPPEVGSDWTIIDDGAVIGKTLNVGGYYEARWYFGNEGEQRKFLYLKTRLRSSSARYRPRPKSQSNRRDA